MSEYTDRITPEHADKPKFVALVDAITSDFSGNRDAILSLVSAFDLDEAIGAQLDVIGIWVGIGRNVDTPIENVYFSFDLPGLGFDEGTWKGEFDPATGISSLPDDVYRILLKAKIGANRWDGSMARWKAIVELVFPAETLLFVQDNADMTITVGVSGVRPSALFLALLQGGYLPIKPEAIGIKYAITTVNQTPIFGFDQDNEYIGGFDRGAWSAPTYQELYGSFFNGSNVYDGTLSYAGTTNG